MNRYVMAAQQIKDTVSAREAGEAMGLEIRRGRCRCPLHGGNDFNCVLYAGNRGFYCHVCKSGGDVLSFAQRYYDMSFKDTVAWFNATFHMGLELEGRMDPQETRRAENALQMRKEANALKEERERMKFDLAMTADLLLEKLEEQRDRNVPKTPDEKWNDAFCEAVRTIPEARMFAEECMNDCIREKG